MFINTHNLILQYIVYTIPAEASLHLPILIYIDIYEFILVYFF